jgi:hypothetical protein
VRSCSTPCESPTANSAFAGEVPGFVEEIRRIFERAEIQGYVDNVGRVGALGHVASDEASRERMPWSSDGLDHSISSDTRGASHSACLMERPPGHREKFADRSRSRSGRPTKRLWREGISHRKVIKLAVRELVTQALTDPAVWSDAVERLTDNLKRPEVRHPRPRVRRQGESGDRARFRRGPRESRDHGENERGPLEAAGPDASRTI